MSGSAGRGSGPLRAVLVVHPADMCTHHEHWVRSESGTEQGEGGRGGGPGTLTGVLGQPGSDADLQHFVTGLEDGQVTEALVELHLPGAPCTPGTPILLFQLEFKPATRTFVGNGQEHHSKRMVLADPSGDFCCWASVQENEASPDDWSPPGALRGGQHPGVWHSGAVSH